MAANLLAGTSSTSTPTVERETLVLTARALAALFALAAPLNLVALEGAARVVLPVLATLTGLLCLAVSLRARTVPADRLNRYLFVLSATPLVGPVVLVALSRELEHTALLMLSLVGIAALNPRRSQVLLISGVAVSAWTVVVVLVHPSPVEHLPVTVMQLALAGTLATAVFCVRTSVQRRLSEAHHRLGEHVTALQELGETAELGHRRFRSVFDDSPVGIGLSDEQGRFVEANQALCDLFGRSWPELAGRSSAEFTHPSDLYTNASAGQLLAAAPDGIARLEKRYVRPDGEVRWAWLTVRTVAGPEGASWTLAHVQDVTDRKKVDEELLRSREGLRASIAIARAAQEGTDPRPLVLESIASLAHVSTVSLLEQISDDHLAVTATTGVENLVGVTIDLNEQSATGHVWRTGQALFASHAEEHPMVSKRLLAQSGATSLLWQPVGIDGHVTAVLALGWNDRVDSVSETERAAVEALAAETAMALNSERMRQRLELTVVTDTLTGLLNRRGWDEQTTSLARQSYRTREPFTIALLDLDHFKAYNDAHGHVVADQALVEFALGARRSMRVVDVIARWGGEEFAIALRDTTRDQARATLERVRCGMPPGLTCSIGYAEVRSGETVSEALSRADAALYRAKRNGRDRLEEAVEAMADDIAVGTLGGTT